jgi:hypothetical protein
MSILTLEQLRATRTRAEWRETVLTVLSDLGFSGSSWQTGSVQRTIVEAIALLGATLQANVAALSYLVFNDDASGDMLSGLSESHFANTRGAATSTTGYVRFTGAASGPPHTIAASGAVVAATVGTATYQYRNLAEFTVPISDYVDVLVEAEEAGEGPNVANGVITTLVTSYAGVSVSNPAYGTTGTWIAERGENEETDAALRARNAAKWSTLSVITAVDDRYEYLARTAVNNCRVRIDQTNPDGPGTARLYLAGETGVADSGQVADAQDVITAAYLGGGVTVEAASALTVDVTATVYYSPSAASADVQDAVEDAIDDHLNAAPIGGYSYGTGEENLIDLESLVAAMSAATGVRRVILTAPAADVAVGLTEVAVTGTVTLTMIAAAS